MRGSLWGLERLYSLSRAIRSSNFFLMLVAPSPAVVVEDAPAKLERPEWRSPLKRKRSEADTDEVDQGYTPLVQDNTIVGPSSSALGRAPPPSTSSVALSSTPLPPAQHSRSAERSFAPSSLLILATPPIDACMCKTMICSAYF